MAELHFLLALPALVWLVKYTLPPDSRFVVISLRDSINVEGERNVIIQERSKDTPGKLQGCSKSPPRILQGYSKDAPRRLQGNSKDTTISLQGLSKDTTR